MQYLNGIVALLMLTISTVNAQISDTVQHKNIEINGSMTIDNIRNFSGGMRTGASTLALIDFDVTYAFNNGILKNTTLYAHFLKTAGQAPSGQFIGDVQVVSNIEGRAAALFYELLVRRRLGGFTISAGLHDLNSEFMVSDYAGDFINSSFGISPTVSLNLPVSIYPMTTFGGFAAYKRKLFDIVGGIYNLNHTFAEEETFRVNRHFFQHGYLGVAEVRFRWLNSAYQKGEYKIGGYLKHCNHEEHHVEPDDCVSEYNYGLYFIGDHELFQLKSGSRISAFLQFNITPTAWNYASEYIGAGISIRNNAYPWLPDYLGIAACRVKLNKLQHGTFVSNNRFESVLELTCAFQVFEQITIQPDVQYIIKPAGEYNNALAGMVRFITELN